MTVNKHRQDVLHTKHITQGASLATISKHLKTSPQQFYSFNCTYSVQRGIRVLVGTRRACGSIREIRKRLWIRAVPSRHEQTFKELHQVILKATYRCFTNWICMKPAEVALVVDRKSFQEISLWKEGEVTVRLCSSHFICLSSSTSYIQRSQVWNHLTFSSLTAVVYSCRLTATV